MVCAGLEMNKVLLLTTLFFSCFWTEAIAITVSSEDAQFIAEKIWINECGGTVEGLTFWNKDEGFPSLGIGHFIWYPNNRKDRFEETFPDLLSYLQSNDKDLPEWLTQTDGCPWCQRDDFYADIDSAKMNSLRDLLYQTRDLQAIFISKRLEKKLPEIIDNLSNEEKERVTKTFNRLSEIPVGLYALIDYLNFKGSRTSQSEMYNEQGWGLRQVLVKIPEESDNVVEDFVIAAKEVLINRVKNSPSERNEERWLQSWINRVETYR